MGACVRALELEEVPMPIVGGLDIHRKQITFDYLDTGTGQVRRGQITPADRAHLRAWLARFAGREDAAFAVEGCTGWRYVAEELAAAGVAAHLAEPADTAFARGRKRHAKTDKTDCRHLRMLLAEGRLPECWIPPARILECRALLETYHDLRAEHTAWVQRIHAVLFHQGAPALGEGMLRTGQGVAALRAAAAGCLSPAGQLQVATAVEVLEALEARMHVVRHQLLDAARHLAGAKVLAARLYGVGPVTALAMTCWLAGEGRFSPPARRSGSPGWTSPSPPPTARGRPGGCPGKDRRCCAGRSMRPARPTPGPRPLTTPTTPRLRTAAAASAPRCPRPARSSARPATSWPSSATTRSPPSETPHSSHGDQPVTTPAPAGHTAAALTRWGPPRPAPAEPLSAAAGPAPQGQADGLIRLSGRIPPGGDTQSIIMSPGQHPRPADLGKAGCSCPAPGRHGRSPRTERPPA